MHLLNVRTKELSKVSDDSVPPYAILSHTWGPEEVTFQELQTLNEYRGQSPLHPISSKAGYHKIKSCCDQAMHDGFDWVWIDTCCIDKTSSAELSEAINSMFRWYKESKVCYAYLGDVPAEGEHLEAPGSKFRNSRWFTRGWTLQELLAPDNLLFFGKSWCLVGDRMNLRHVVGEITGISPSFLIQRNLPKASIAQRMSWAAKRETTRKEDMAYCLLGIFDINMPLLYGEGEKAFRRLQEEIIKQSNDQTILAWGFGQPDRVDTNTDLAKAPSDFAECGDVVPCSAWKPKHSRDFEITQQGLRIELPCATIRIADERHVFGLLNCRLSYDFSNIIAIPLGSLGNTTAFFSFDGADIVTDTCRRRAPKLYEESTLRYANFETVCMTTLKSATMSFSATRVYHGSALIQRSKDLVCRALYVDPPLATVIRGEDIIVCGPDISSPRVWTLGDGLFRMIDYVISALPKFPRTLRAYYHCGTEESRIEPSQPGDFLLLVEFSQKSNIIRVFGRIFFENFMHWEVRCFITRAPFTLSADLPTSEYFQALEWSHSITSGGLMITAQVHKRTTLGYPINIITLEETSREQSHITRLTRIFTNLLFAPKLRFLNSDLKAQHRPLTEIVPKFIRAYFLFGIGFSSFVMSSRLLTQQQPVACTGYASCWDATLQWRRTASYLVLGTMCISAFSSMLHTYYGPGRFFFRYLIYGFLLLEMCQW